MSFRRFRVVSIFVLALLLVAAIFISDGTAQDVGSGGIGGRPAFPRKDNPRSESIFIHTLEPGSSVNEGVNVINNSDSTSTVLVYPTDSIVSSGGAFACEQLVEEKNEVGSWITMSKNEVTLDSADSEIVPFTITIPANTSVGEHNGCIVVQGKLPPEQTEQGIGLSFRTAVRVAILVPGEIVKDLEITSFSSNVGKDKVTLTPEITNTGNVSVDADIQTTLKYFFGMTASQVGGQFPVLRDQTGEWNFDHDRPFWGGLFKAEVTAQYDDNLDSYIGDETSSIKTLQYPSHWQFVMPHPLALLIELMVLIIIIFAVYDLIKRNKQHRDIKNSWRNHTIAASDTIKSLAKAYDISWKKLAKANGIKAPYTLEQGSIIKVPKKSNKS